jgi:CubicO group peptidase (beta-lactamase class C family)
MPWCSRTRLVTLLVTLSAASGAGPLGAQDGPAPAISPDRLEAVERFVERNWSRLGLPGVAVGVATADSVVLALGFGPGSQPGTSITGDTPFHVGSVTKTFTAAATAHLARESHLDLDAPVETWLPDFTLRPPFTPGSITPDHLLRHRSGLSQWSGHDRRAQEEGRFEHLAPSRPAGERAEYSSLNFIILGRLLEEVSGASYDELLSRHLFGPLGMESAFVDGSGARPGDLAPGHQGWFGLQRGKSEPLPLPHLVPAGFAGASARDMARYGGMMVGYGEFAGTRVLERETVEAIIGPLDEVGSALGWGRSRRDGTLVLGHSGNARTTSARMRLIPEEGYALVVLSNTNSGPLFAATDALLDGVHAILQGEPEPRLWPLERGFKVVVLVGTAMALVGMGRQAGRWHQAGHPVGVRSSAAGRLALDVGMGGVILIGLPRYIGVPLPTMMEYFPDLGTAIVVSAGAGMVGGVLKAFTRSAR